MSIRICLDPGHGGYDPGATNRDTREKDITLNIGLQLRDLLQRAGFSIVMTRESDVSPGGYRDVYADLRERCRISDAAQVDVFLSIHVNAGGGRGAEIYVYKNGGNIRPLAQSIVDNVASVVGYHGQPIKDGRELYVIRNTSAPAMLLEIGFIDSDDLPKIQANIDKFAPLIAKAFCQFYGVQEVKSKMSQEDANKITAILSQVWTLLNVLPETEEARKEIGRLADEVRLAAGLPTKNR